jgi:hypothetical protein
METTVKVPQFIIGNQDFRFIGDLEWFEGSLLSLMHEVTTNRLFWLHWVDIKEGTNLWLLFPVTTRSMKLYLDGKLSNADMLDLSQVDTVKLIGLNGDWNLKNYEIIPISKLAQKYFPSADFYFDSGDCQDLTLIQTFVNKMPLESVEIRVDKINQIEKILTKNEFSKGDSIKLLSFEEKNKAIWGLSLIFLMGVFHAYFSQKKPNISVSKNQEEEKQQDISLFMRKSPKQIASLIENTFGVILERVVIAKQSN